MVDRKTEEKVTQNGLTGYHLKFTFVGKYVLSIFETIKIITNREASNRSFCPPAKITARVSTQTNDTLKK